MNKLLFLLLFFISINILSQKNQNVVYGEKENYYKPSENSFGLFLDKNGDFYPKQFILDKDLIAFKSSLKDFYKNNVSKFIGITTKYGLKFDTFTNSNFISFQEILSESIIKNMNEFSKESHLYVLIHGFRKPFIKQKRGTTSIEDYNSLKTSIYEIDKNAKFIEVYWDGMYDSVLGKNSSKLKVMYKLYENEGQQNAAITGYALRKIISKISLKNYNIVTHSLGAQVGISLLTNTYKKRVSKHCFDYKTPSQSKINIFLIAPAMSKDPFNDYYDRTTNLNFREKDNYNLAILYNKKDIVLRKKLFIFGPGPKKYGDTSLGCNYKNEIVKLLEMFTQNFEKSPFKTYNTTRNKDHRIRNYVKTENFITHIEELSHE
jgi:hypothetical protein